MWATDPTAVAVKLIDWILSCEWIWSPYSMCYCVQQVKGQYDQPVKGGCGDATGS